MDIRLKVVQGKPLGKQFRLPVSRFVIGRADDCHLKPNSDLVDSHQCAIVNEGGEVRVQHLGQANGTHVNGKAVQGEVAVKTGDLLQIGPLVFAFNLVSTPDDAKTEKPAPQEPAAPPADQPSAATSDSKPSAESAEPKAAPKSTPPVQPAPTKPAAPPAANADNEEDLASSLLDVAADSPPTTEVEPHVEDVPQKPATVQTESSTNGAKPEPRNAAAEATSGESDVEQPVLDVGPAAIGSESPAAPKKQSPQPSAAKSGEDGDVLDWLMDGDDAAPAVGGANAIAPDGAPAFDPGQPAMGEPSAPGEAKKKGSYEKTSSAAADILRRWMQGGQQ